jgi:hypothetical protein
MLFSLFVDNISERVSDMGVCNADSDLCLD